MLGDVSIVLSMYRCFGTIEAIDDKCLTIDSRSIVFFWLSASVYDTRTRVRVGRVYIHNTFYIYAEFYASNTPYRIPNIGVDKT